MAYNSDRDHYYDVEHWIRRPARPTSRPGFAHEKALVFSIIQVLAGIASVALAVVAVVTRAWGFYYGSGFWGGGFFIATGVLGLVASRRKTNCTLVSYMIMSAIAAMLALVTLALSAIAFTSDNMLWQEIQMQEGSTMVVHSLIIVTAAIEAASASVASIICCRAVCGDWYGHSYEVTTRYSDSHYMDNDDRPERHEARPPIDAYAPSVIPGISDLQHLPFRGAQQIAIVAPVGIGNSGCPETVISDGGMVGRQGTYVIQATGAGTGFTQVMYIMSAGPSVIQPGQEPNPDEIRPPGTPPPSYSQLDLTNVPDLHSTATTENNSVDIRSIESSQGQPTMSQLNNAGTVPNGSANILRGPRRTDSYRRSRNDEQFPGSNISRNSSRNRHSPRIPPRMDNCQSQLPPKPESQSNSLSQSPPPPPPPRQETVSQPSRNSPRTSRPRQAVPAQNSNIQSVSQSPVSAPRLRPRSQRTGSSVYRPLVIGNQSVRESDDEVAEITSRMSSISQHNQLPNRRQNHYTHRGQQPKPPPYPSRSHSPLSTVL